jgi:hypothetical protein
MRMIDDVVRRFRNGLTDLVQDLDGTGLTPDTFLGFIGDLKSLISEIGLRAFTETVLRHEEASDIVEDGGQLHRYKMDSDKEWITPFGLAVIPRRYFQPDRGGEGVVPLDVRCGMVDRPMTPDVEELCAFSGAHLVPREVETLLGKLLPHRPSATAVQHVIEHVSEVAEWAEDEIEEAVRKQTPLSTKGDVLVQSWDGVTVPLREKGKKTGRKPERPGVREDDTDTSPTAWKEAGVATISIYSQDEEGRPKRLDTRYLARMPEKGMAWLLEQQNSIVSPLLRRELRRIVFLCDGKHAIWTAAEKLVSYPMATLILDFFHATEHLSKAAEALFGKKSVPGKRWYNKNRARLRDDVGGAKSAIRAMQYYLRKRRLRKGSERYKTVKRVIGYFRRNLPKMTYAEFRAQGLPIGSGPVEAACKTVVGARLKRSGMRWTREGGQRVLNLRTHVLSKRWDVFWNTYLEIRQAA